MHLLSIVSIGCGLLLLPFLAPSSPQDPAAKAPRYIGAAQCKNCHNGADKGNAYDHWAQTPHAKAFETLASDKAKEIAKKEGIADAQKSEKCLKCHVTAFDAKKAEFKATFKPENGVQCESCHGPGENHQKKRFAEAMKKAATPAPLTADEVHASRSMDTCKKCHNPDSPTYKPFCLVERMEKIEHLDPRKKRTEEELAKLRATCDPECAKCKEKKGGAAKEPEKKDGGK